MTGTEKPHESLTRSTVTSMMARRAGPGSVSNRASRSAKPGESGNTASPRPCSRTMFGGPSNAQNMITMRPFSRRCAIVSTPLAV